MTVLSETQRLLMEPGSNQPIECDDSWIHLLPISGRIAVIGEPDAHIRRLLEDRFGAERVIDGASVSNADVAIVATSSSAVIADRMTLLDSTPDVVHLPGSATPALDRTWLVVEPRRRGSVWIRRARTAARLVRTRSYVLVAGRPPSSARRHASDVAFVRVPADLRNRPARHAVGLGRHAFRVPSSLQSLVESEGIRLDEGTWAFGPPRGFASQKIVFGLRTIEGSRIFVKLTQDRRFNDRLAAEGRALDRLGSIGLESLALPEVLFRGRIGDLFVLGQTELRGTPFRMTSDGDPSGDPAHGAVEAIIELGARTAMRQPAGATGRALVGLIDDFERIYGPPVGVSERLRASAEHLGRLDIPSVSMHGDFGVWNLMTVGNGTVGALDWENADPEGVPLWDLFVFARTFGVLAADLAGRRYGPGVFEEQFSSPSPLRDSLTSWVREYCEAVGVPKSAVQGLFELCWVQQSVREAASIDSPTWLGSPGTRFVQAALGAGGFDD